MPQCEFILESPTGCERGRCGKRASDFCEVISREGDGKRRWMWLCVRHVNRYRLVYCWQVEGTMERAMKEARQQKEVA